MDHRLQEMSQRERALLWFLLLFYVVYAICAVLLQLRSGEPPETSGTVTDVFTGSLLWAISIISLLFASLRMPSTWRAIAWLGLSAAAGAVAIDELFEFHEATRFIVGDDDYIKILTLPVAIAGLYFLYRLEQPRRRVATLFVLGLGFHTLYLISDMGDGDFFQLPVPLYLLLWAEELLELFAIQCYLAGFLLHFTIVSENVRPSEQAHS